jgi:hypothetical protein
MRRDEQPLTRGELAFRALLASPRAFSEWAAGRRRVWAKRRAAEAAEKAKAKR